MQHLEAALRTKLSGTNLVNHTTEPSSGTVPGFSESATLHAGKLTDPGSSVNSALGSGYVTTCRSRQSRPVFGNLRWGAAYLSNTENSRAVFSPSEMWRGLLRAARERPPLYAPRPPQPGVWPRAADAPPLVPSCGGERAPTASGAGRGRHKLGRRPSRGAKPVFMRASARGGPRDHFVLLRMTVAPNPEA